MKNSGNLTAYKLWAPDGVLWTQWVKPILFADRPMGNMVNADPLETLSKAMKKKPVGSSTEVDISELIDTPEPLELPEPSRIIDLIDHAAADTAIIVDLPGVMGIDTAMALAHLGYRPVPLYNGVCSLGNNVIDSEKIADAMIARANELAAIDLDDDAPPAFMLDSDRMSGVGMPREFDNRWRVFPQDMPSAVFLKQHGIQKVIVCYKGIIESDLEHILYRYQKQMITIHLYDGKGGIDEKTIFNKPNKFGKAFYRFMVTVGLKRNAAGGFGGMIPEESESSYGGG